VVAVLLPGGGAGADDWTPRPASYKVHATTDVRISMSDGVRLTADILRPADDAGSPVPGQFPVLLTQTPYNKNGINFRSDYMVTRGYVQVIAEVRGTGSSEGTWDSFGTREQIDGGELVDWVAAQPWSDGRVALHGTSYGAINQLFTAALRPGAVKAIFPIVPMADAYRDITGSGGQINTSFIPLWLGLVTGLGALPPTYTPSDPVGAAGALASHAAGAVNFQANAVAQATTGGDNNAYDSPFFRVRSPIEVIDRVQAPAFLVGGWYDLFQRGTPLLYERLAANGVESKLLMGPWYHITAGQGLPNADVGFTLDELELRWFDHHVLGVADPGLEDMAPVTYVRAGTDRYETASEWPPAGVTARELHLGAGGALGVEPSGEPDTMVWHPASGACTRSSVQWTAGVGENTPCETDHRANDATGLVYDMPVADGLDITGPMNARLFVSTNGRDAFLTVRVEDVAPDGEATQISAGWNVLSLRALDDANALTLDGHVIRPYHPFTKASELGVEADEVYELQVEVFPVAAHIAPGHSLRVSIQPSDAPHLSAPVTQTAALAGSVLRLHHDAEHPSALIVPVG
jgi:putative CocE/NonD family hydrolase